MITALRIAHGAAARHIRSAVCPAVAGRLLCLLGPALAGAAGAADIHKWVDERGQTHYGNAVPSIQRGKAKPVDVSGSEVTDAQREQGEARAASEKSRAEAVFRRPQGSGNPAARAPAALVGPAIADKGTRCDLAWQRYRDSQACFAPYRNVNGSIRAEAFSKCVEMQEPVGC